MNAALRAYIPTVPLPDPEISPLERVVLDEHPVALLTRVTDIENECEHGNLPFDPDPGCECWTRARTAALLGQAPLDDGCPGLDRAAAFDVSVPSIRVSGQGDHEEPAADVEVAELYEFYLRDEQGFGSTAERFGLKRKQVRALFEQHGLALKDPRRGWQARNRKIFTRQDHDQEVQVHTSHNGAEATVEPFGPTAQEIHAWYMDDDTRTLSDVCEHFSLSSYKVKQQFEAAGLPCKPRGGSRQATPDEPGPTATPEIPTADPETQVEGIAAAVVLLERERDELQERLLRVAVAIDTVRELAA